MNETFIASHNEGEVPAAQSPTSNTFDPKRLMVATWRLKYWVILIGVLGIGGTAYYTSKLPRAYAATASVMLESPANPMNSQPQAIRAEANKWHIVLAMSREVRDRTMELAKERVKESRLRAEKESGEKPASNNDKLLPQPSFERPTYDEQMIFFPVVDFDAERAAVFANAWADVFIEELTKSIQTPRQNARKELKRRHSEQVSEFERKQNELNEASKSVDLKKLADKREFVEDLTRRTNAKQAEIETLNAKWTESAARAAAPLDLDDLNQPGMVQLRDLIRIEQELRKLYEEEKSEALRNAIANRKALEASIIKSNKKDAEKWLEKLETARREWTMINDARDTGSQALAIMEKGAQRLNVLTAATAKEKQDVVDLESQINTLDQTEYLFQTFARRSDFAYANTAAIRPDVKKNLLTAGFASIFAAIVLVLGLEYLDQTVKTPLDLEQKVSGETIGFIPLLAPTKSNLKEGIFPIQCSFASDNMRNLQVKLDMALGARRKGNASVIVVTSALPSEGKSFLALNLAFSYAKSGQKVLLVDGDFRKATLSFAHNCQDNIGMGEAICSGEFNREATVSTEIPDCAFLPAGTMIQSDLGFVKPGSIDVMLNKLKPHYDVIVIDSVPVLALADACIMANLADLALLVARSRVSKFIHVQRAAAMLKAARPKALCVVVNAVEASDASSDDYYYASSTYGVAAS